jgi:hypothetical protein
MQHSERTVWCRVVSVHRRLGGTDMIGYEAR